MPPSPIFWASQSHAPLRAPPPQACSQGGMRSLTGVWHRPAPTFSALGSPGGRFPEQEPQRRPSNMSHKTSSRRGPGDGDGSTRAWSPQTLKEGGREGGGPEEREKGSRGPRHTPSCRPDPRAERPVLCRGPGRPRPRQRQRENTSPLGFFRFIVGIEDYTRHQRHALRDRTEGERQRRKEQR